MTNAQKRRALSAWAYQRGFVQSIPDSDTYWEIAYSHTTGHGWITVRVSGAGRHGFDLIVEQGDGSDRHGIALGCAPTLDALASLVDGLLSLDYKGSAYEADTEQWLERNKIPHGGQ